MAPSRPGGSGQRRGPLHGGRPVSVSVSDGRGRPVRDGGLAGWLARVLPAGTRGAIAVALVSDRQIRDLNRRYRGRNSATDVLSFPADVQDRSVPRSPGGSARGSRRRARIEPATSSSASRLMGDIVIATGVARRQARGAGHSYATELRVLALHGALHLLGYDHESDDDGGRMARAETRLRRRGGLRQGLIGRERRR